jgi:hypothetical protein
MRIMTEIRVEVSAYYHDIEGLRFKPQYGTDREGDFYRLLAKATLNDDGTVGSVYVTASGHYVKKDGTTGLADARIRFGSLHVLPQDWRTRIMTDLETLAERVIVRGSGAFAEMPSITAPDVVTASE